MGSCDGDGEGEGGGGDPGRAHRAGWTAVHAAIVAIDRRAVHAGSADAAIREDAQLAQMLLVDMRRCDRNDGATLRDALGVLVPAAHRRLVAGFGIGLGETLLVEWDGYDGFFSLRVVSDAARCGPRDVPILVSRTGDPAGRSCTLGRAGSTGAAMLDKVDAVVGGAGVEG